MHRLFREKRAIKNKTLLGLAAIATLMLLMLTACVVTTLGASSVAEITDPFVARYGPPTGDASAVPPVPAIVYADASNPWASQVWTWAPLPATDLLGQSTNAAGKTLTLTVFSWQADWSNNRAWKSTVVIK